MSINLIIVNSQSTEKRLLCVRVLTIFQPTNAKMKAKIIGISMVAAVAVSLTLAIMFVDPAEINVPSQEEDPFADWNRSGPFAVNKFEYVIGENVFVVADKLKPHEFGNVIFLMPNGTTRYITIPFDGSDKPGFNQYFRPGVSAARSICSTDDLVGDWTVVFQGANYNQIKFKILNQTLDSNEAHFRKVC